MFYIVIKMENKNNISFNRFLSIIYPSLEGAKS